MADSEQALLIARDRAAKAKVLLEDPLLVEMFDTLEARLIEEWKKSPPGADADRERAWQAVRVLMNIRDMLEKLVINGGFAGKALDALHPGKS